MRRRIGFLITLILCAFGGHIFAENRTFTNREGKTIEAEITTVREGKVYLKQGAKSYAVPFDQLSDEDQAYIRKWVKDNFDYRLLFQANEAELKEERTSDRTRKDGNRDTKESETWKYGVKITNRSGIDLKDLEVRYVIVVRETHTADPGLGKKSSKEKSRTVTGTATIENLTNTDSATVVTQKVGLGNHKWENQKSRIVRRSSSDGGDYTQYYWDKYSDESDLDGIWVRVFLGDRMIADWKSEGKLIKTIQWNGGGPK